MQKLQATGKEIMFEEIKCVTRRETT